MATHETALAEYFLRRAQNQKEPTMNTKQIYVYRTGEFFSIDMGKLSYQTIDEIIHYGLEKFLNQKANAVAKRSTHREDIKAFIACLAADIEQGYITIPRTKTRPKTLEEKVTAKLLAMTDKEKEVYRKLLTE